MDKKGKTSDLNKKPQVAQEPRDEWEQDLHPNHMAGQNIGRGSGNLEKELRTAYDVKPLHRSLSGIPDDDLKQIPVLPEGARLQQGATYINLQDDRPEEFTATGDIIAERGQYYIPKSEVRRPAER